MKLQWAGEFVYSRVTVFQKTTHLYAVLHDCNQHDDKNFLTKISENCCYKLNFDARLQCLDVGILTILSVMHCWNSPVRSMYCFRILFV